MNCLIVSGMSGAGKSTAIDVLEDVGYYCVDNMPAPLIPRFVELFMDSSSNKYRRVAFVVDVRGDSDFVQLFATLEEMKLNGIDCKVLFLDCDDQTVINRQQAARRKHPLDRDGMGMAAAVAEERRRLEVVRERADFLIDTTSLSAQVLGQHLIDLFGGEEGKRRMLVSINTFGFKYGIPHESDIVFDVRFLKNPYYVPELKEKTGLDQDVADYVFQFNAAGEFLTRVSELLNLLIPLYLGEGKTSLVVSIGCTGGRHRSVAIGQRLCERLGEMGHHAVISHRDKEKG